MNKEITPSIDALLIDAAHKSLRDALGTRREAMARAYLELVVANARVRQAERNAGRAEAVS